MLSDVLLTALSITAVSMGVITWTAMPRSQRPRSIGYRDNAKPTAEEIAAAEVLLAMEGYRCCPPGPAQPAMKPITLAVIEHALFGEDDRIEWCSHCLEYHRLGSCTPAEHAQA